MSAHDVELAPRQPPKLVIDRREETSNRFLVPRFDRSQEIGDLSRAESIFWRWICLLGHELATLAEFAAIIVHGGSPGSCLLVGPLCEKKNKEVPMAGQRAQKSSKRVKNLPAKTLTLRQARRVTGGIVVQGTRLADGSVTKVSDGSVSRLCDGSVFKLSR